MVRSFRFESHCLGLSSLEPDSDARLKVKEFIWQVKGMLAGERNKAEGNQGCIIKPAARKGSKSLISPRKCGNRDALPRGFTPKGEGLRYLYPYSHP